MSETVHDRQTLLNRDGHPWDQALLRSRSALVCGCGNIGDPLAIMLARLGFGRVDTLDHDSVELPNLSRGVCATPADLGRPKAEVVSETIARLCPDVQTTALVGNLLGEWPCTLFGRYHVVLLATHDPVSRLFVNRMVHRFPDRTLAIVEGALTEWSFSVQTIAPGRSPCYECSIGSDFMNDDIGQGCGGLVTERETRSAATNGPTGMAVASLMATEAGLVGAGLRPCWMHHRYEFDGHHGTGAPIERTLRESCDGHRRIPERDRLSVPCGADPTVRAIRESVARELNVVSERVRLYPFRLMVERLICLECGIHTTVRRPQAMPTRPVCACGNANLDRFSVRTLKRLTDRDDAIDGTAAPARLSQFGLGEGEVVQAHVLLPDGEWSGPLFVQSVAAAGEGDRR